MIHTKRGERRHYKKALIPLAILVVLSPLGLLASGTAWGEWGTDEIRALLGYIPHGLSRLANINHIAFLRDYSLPGLGRGFVEQAAGYYLSAIVGIAIIVIVVLGIGRLIVRK